MSGGGGSGNPLGWYLTQESVFMGNESLSSSVMLSLAALAPGVQDIVFALTGRLPTY
jgi:hypothetical protein